LLYQTKYFQKLESDQNEEMNRITGFGFSLVFTLGFDLGIVLGFVLGLQISVRIFSVKEVFR